jgi:hypothetical protein
MLTKHLFFGFENLSKQHTFCISARPLLLSNRSNSLILLVELTRIERATF